MPTPRPTIAEEIERYLRTGDYDVYCTAWPGSVIEQARRASDDLRDALIAEVLRRAEGRPKPNVPPIDIVAHTRQRVEPMVRGLFPRKEQAAILAMLETSVVFLHHANVAEVLAAESYPHSAWTLANLYLGSVGADPLGGEYSVILGLSQANTCFVSPAYFTCTDPFADYIVHEAAHVFHNSRRDTVGLPETRTKERFLNVPFHKHELFAYSCEAYSCILRQGRSRAERLQLAETFTEQAMEWSANVNGVDVAAVVSEAVKARNGWKVILSRCAPDRPLTARRRAGAPAA